MIPTSTSRHGHSPSYNHRWSRQRQQQAFAPRESVQSMETVETQLLCEQVEQLIASLWKFVEALQHSKGVEFANKKAVGLCNAFGMTCDGFYADETVNEKALGLAANMIIQFEEQVGDARFGDVHECIEPMLNYAKRAVRGEPTPNLKCILTQSRPRWSQEVANKTTLAFQAAHHHVDQRKHEIMEDEERFRQMHNEKWNGLGRAVPDVGRTTPSGSMDSFYKAMACGESGSFRYDDSEVIENPNDVDIDYTGAPMF